MLHMIFQSNNTFTAKKIQLGISLFRVLYLMTYSLIIIAKEAHSNEVIVNLWNERPSK